MTRVQRTDRQREVSLQIADLTPCFYCWSRVVRLQSPQGLNWMELVADPWNHRRSTSPHWRKEGRKKKTGSGAIRYQHITQSLEWWQWNKQGELCFQTTWNMITLQAIVERKIHHHKGMPWVTEMRLAWKSEYITGSVTFRKVCARGIRSGLRSSKTTIKQLMLLLDNMCQNFVT